MKKMTFLLAFSTIALLSHSFAFSNECQKINNPYLPTYESDEVRQEIFEHNGQYVLTTLKQNTIDSISEDTLNELLHCLRDSTKLGDPIAAVTLSNILVHLAKPETLKEAYLTRIIANTHQKYDVMSDLKRSFRNLGPDTQILEMAFSDKSEDDFVEIFSTESHLAVSDLEDLKMAFRDIWDNMPALSEYLITHSKKDSVGEMLGMIALQESSINAFKKHENNLDDHLIIADYVMNHLEYRPSYDFSKAVYETALTQGDAKQQAHAKSQLQKLESFLAKKVAE